MSDTGVSQLLTAARNLFDNRLGWSDGRQPYAPRALWADLGAALYGESDLRVTELRGDVPTAPPPSPVPAQCANPECRSNTEPEEIDRAAQFAIALGFLQEAP